MYCRFKRKTHLHHAAGSTGKTNNHVDITFENEAVKSKVLKMRPQRDYGDSKNHSIRRATITIVDLNLKLWLTNFIE